MSRPKPKRWSIRFELAPENEQHKRLYEYLDKLSESDEASKWIRATLIAALHGQVAAPKSQGGVRSTGKSSAPPARIEIVDDVEYEDIDE